MAQQGLFTQGPSVQDLLTQRNKRAGDLQQQLMMQAAQGARNPAKMRAVSLLGSSLGRALAGGMGGQDKQREQLETKNAQQKALQQQFGHEYSQGTPESNIKFGNELIQLGYSERGAQLIESGKKALQERKLKEDAVKLAQAKQADLDKRGLALAARLPKGHPSKAILERGNITEADYRSAFNSDTSAWESNEKVKTETAAKTKERLSLEGNSNSIALLLGQEDNPELYTALTTAPTTAIYKRAVTLLDKEEKVEKGTDIVSRYWATDAQGKSVRVGDTRDGKQVLMTATGQQPVTGPLTNVTNRTEVVDNPAQLARTSYEYVNKSPRYKKIQIPHDLAIRADGIFKDLEAGSSSARPILYRTISEMYNGDSKAASEIQKLQEAGTISDKIFNSIVAGTAGGLTDATTEQLRSLVAIGRKAINTTLGQTVSQEYRSRIGSFEDPSMLQNQLLTFFAPSQILDTADPEVHTEGRMFEGNGPNAGKFFMVVAGHIIQL
jgi:hypothetical protein